MSQTVRLGLIQTDAGTNPDENVHKTKQLIRRAAGQGAQVICTQELFTSTYFCQHHDEAHFELAIGLDHDYVKSMGHLAEELGVVIISSIFEKRDAGLYHNTAVIHNTDGKMLGHYRKMHIPEDPGFHEKYYFTPGDTGFKVFDTKFGRLGLLICWDQWFPEAARITALKGAQILFYPTAIGVLPDENSEIQQEYMEAWEVMHRSHAVANGCFVASVNRVGRENDIRFWGDSFVAGPFGKILVKGGNEEEIVLADCDLGLIEKQRRTWPFFRDRRIDAYGDILKRMDN